MVITVVMPRSTTVDLAFFARMPFLGFFLFFFFLSAPFLCIIFYLFVYLSNLSIYLYCVRGHCWEGICDEDSYVCQPCDHCTDDWFSAFLTCGLSFSAHSTQYTTRTHTHTHTHTHRERCVLCVVDHFYLLRYPLHSPFLC